MTWLSVLQLVLQIASIIARQVERAKVEKAFADALILAVKDRADAAVAAADAVGMPDVSGDPNNRDGRGNSG